MLLELAYKDLAFKMHTIKNGALTPITVTAGPTKAQIVPPTGDSQQLSVNKTKIY